MQNAYPEVQFDQFNQFETLSSEAAAQLDQTLSANFKRKTVVVVFRHGHRTPFRQYRKTSFSEVLEKSFYENLDMSWFSGKEKQMYKNVECLPYSNGGPTQLNLQFDVNVRADGMLTRLGAFQLHSLGQACRARYADEVTNIISRFFTPDEDDPDTSPILSISTRTERTIESLCSMLAGLFHSEALLPLVKILVFDSIEANWLLVPFRTYPELLEGVYVAHSHQFKCATVPGYRQWSENFLARSGMMPESLDIQMARDYATAFHTFNMREVDPVFESEDLSTCNSIATRVVAAESIIVPQGVAKSAVCFFQVLLQLFACKERLLTLLSGHDTTINFIKLALRAQDYTWPDFGFNIEFELYENVASGELCVLVLFNLKPVVLKAISNVALMPLSDFVQFIKCNINV